MRALNSREFLVWGAASLSSVQLWGKDMRSVCFDYYQHSELVNVIDIFVLKTKNMDLFYARKLISECDIFQDTPGIAEYGVDQCFRGLLEIVLHYFGEAQINDKVRGALGILSQFGYEDFKKVDDFVDPEKEEGQTVAKFLDVFVTLITKEQLINFPNRDIIKEFIVAVVRLLSFSSYQAVSKTAEHFLIQTILESIQKRNLNFFDTFLKIILMERAASSSFSLLSFLGIGGGEDESDATLKHYTLLLLLILLGTTQCPVPEERFLSLSRNFMKNIGRPEYMLLLYFVMVNSPKFVSCFVNMEESDEVILLLMQFVYEFVGEKSRFSEIYVLMTILLLLSEHEIYNVAIQELQMEGDYFLREGISSDINFSSALLLVLVKTIQFNLLQIQDVFLHTNCLAVLGNMSSYMKNIHPFAAQKLLELYETFVRRSLRLSSGNLHEEAGMYEDLGGLVIEAICGVLAHNLESNPHLVYALLYKEELLVQSRAHARNAPFVDSIEGVLFD